MITTAKLQKTVVSALEDIKANDIRVLDVRHVTAMFDKVIIASAGSGRQLKALSNNVQAKVKAAGGHVYGVEGENSDDWMLVDVGDIVVHMMQPAQPKPKAPRAPRATPDDPAQVTAAKPPAKRAARSAAGPASAKAVAGKTVVTRARKSAKPATGA
ncbi:MAG: ribosome silencing factor [Proteobacteria bacterium]|nr:ribosome silencing factor [Pseudomonadota bacterium]